MSENLYLISLGLVFGTILAVFGMKYFSAVQQARARILNENAYRELAEKAAATQSENAGTLSSIRAELSGLSTRMAAVEKILKAVE